MAETLHAVGVTEEDDAAQLGAAGVEIERRERRVDAHVFFFFFYDDDDTNQGLDQYRYCPPSEAHH